jgi:copper transport protein
MRRAGAHSWLLLVALLAGWLLAGVGTAAPAAAHAELVSTDPAEGARLEQAPDRITLRFSEPVSLGAGYARVLNPDGTVHAADAAVDDGTLTLVPRDELPVDQGYLVTFRVISADSHPISGTFSFVVGDGELVAGGAGETGDAGDPLVTGALPVARWAGFAGIALAIGVPVLALVCWPAGWASRRLRRLAGGGAAAVVVASAAGFLLQGPYAAATGLATALQPSLLAATAGSGAGRALLIRAVLALGLAAALLPVWRRGAPPSVARTAVAGLSATGVVLATAATGHPVAGPLPGLAVAAAAVHVAAMAVWLGGLTGLLLAVLRPAVPAGEPAAVLPPWSRLAFAAVAALVVSGTVQAVREVGSPTALFVTTSGWVLLAKLVLVAVLLAAAGVSRIWVHQRLGIRRSRPAARRGPPAPAFASGGAPAVDHGPVAVRERAQADGAAEHVPALRRSVLVEVAVAAVVLALSAVLVGTPPARATIDRPVDVLVPLEGSAGPSGTVQISIDPARAGANTLHVYLFDDSGRLTQPAAISVALTEPSQELGPLDVELEPAGPGHYLGDGMTIPGAGTWTLAVTVRLDEFTARTARTDFPVR